MADNDEAFTEKDVIRLAKQILNGVAFLHRNNVVHLDLKVRTQFLGHGRTNYALEAHNEKEGFSVMQPELIRCVVTVFL